MAKSSINFDQGFKEAIDFFKHKQNLPTEKWDDLQRDMHTRAFVVAGATKQALLSDFKSSVLKAMENGTTLDEFRKDFDNIVKKHGWAYNGGKNWRSRVIYQTNIANAYQAGRYKKLMNPAVLKRRPFWMYIHNDSKNPRIDHKSYHGKVLRYDDAFWSTHRPKNGWGCKCDVKPLSMDEVKARGLSVSTHLEKEPLDKGWDYDPAFASWGKQVGKKTFEKVRKQGSIYKSLPASAYFQSPLTKLIPEESIIKKGAKLKTVEKTVEALENSFGTTDPYIKLATGQTIFIDLENFAKHIMAKQDRSYIVPFVKDMIENPQEIWGEFLRNEISGKVLFRQTIVKSIQLEKNRFLLLVTESRDGVMQAMTVIDSTNKNYIEKQRKGILLYKKTEG
ncbi:MAG: hypothetical protein GY793_04720 [Proteobacteria bacterium]|nr:hypothetical protein [Pseudomonadota bacterium]